MVVDRAVLPLSVRSQPWATPTTHVSLHVAQRMDLHRSVLCGIFDYTEVSFRLDATPGSAQVSAGQEISFTLSDPDGILSGSLQTTTKFMLRPKVTEIATWRAERETGWPVTKKWDMPELSWTVEPATKETNENDDRPSPVIQSSRLFVPRFVNNTYKRRLIEIRTDLVFSLYRVGDNETPILTGTTAPLPLHVRG
jgi:hypothetical protein